MGRNQGDNMSKSDWKKLIESKVDDGWIDLEIGNIPSDFFVSEGYEIEWDSLINEKGWSILFKEPNDRHQIIKFITEGQTKFRYRLKPLEPIRVTRKLMIDLSNCVGDVEKHYGRTVEIID